MKRNIIKLTIFLLASLAIFLGLSESMKGVSCTSIASIKGFYTEPKESLDAIMIGASEVYTGYSPTKAWEKYGYTSYDFSSQGISGNLYSSMIREVMKNQTPKVVVFEINGFIYNDDYFKKSEHIHTYIDSMKISPNWLATIREVIPKEKQGDYLNPIATYHDHWKEPQRCVKATVTKLLIKFNDCSNLKGLRTTSAYRNQDAIEPDASIMLTEMGRTYLEDLCQTCQDMGVENVLFVRFPHLRQPVNEEVYPQIEQIVKSYGYDFCNMTDYKKIGLDMDHDFLDNDHLNYYGMEKFTDFFGSYLSAKYDLPNQHDEQLEKRWEFCSKKADEIFDQCEKNFEEGNIRHYIETSCYLDME